MLFLKIYRKILRTIGYIIFNFAKINEKLIIFQSEGDFWDNARALYEYMIQNHYNDKYKMIWLVENPNKYKRHIRRNVVFISYNSFSFNEILLETFYLKTAKYMFFTHRGFKQRRKNQVVIELWHGSIPMKKMETPPTIWKQFDFQVCPSWNAAKRMSLFTGVKENQVIICGDCRQDLLFEDCESKIKNFLKLKDETFVLVMPTFKKSKNWQDGKILPYIFPMVSSQKELEDLNNFCIKNNIKIVIKVHHLEDTTYIKQLNFSHLVVLKDEDLQNSDIQLYELVGKSDALISDFSSIVYDYMLLNKPIGFMLTEKESYKRGFIVDNIENEMFGDKIYTLEDLSNFLLSIKLGNNKFEVEKIDLVNHFFDNKKNGNCKNLIKTLGL